MVVLLSIIATFLYEQYFGGCGVFHYWYSRAGSIYCIVFICFHGTLCSPAIYQYVHLIKGLKKELKETGSGTLRQFQYRPSGNTNGLKLKINSKQTQKSQKDGRNWRRLKPIVKILVWYMAKTLS